LAHKATILATTFGGVSLNTDKAIKAVFADPAKRNQFRSAQLVNLIKDLLSNEEALRELGKSPDDIERILKEKKAAQPVVVAPPQVPLGGVQGQTGGDGEQDNQDEQVGAA
jgi:hypothetical protein